MYGAHRMVEESLSSSVRCGATPGALVLCLLCVGVSGVAAAAPVALEKGTATFSQGGLDGVGPYSPQQAIDGLIFDNHGWTIDHFPNNDPTQEFTTDET